MSYSTLKLLDNNKSYFLLQVEPSLSCVASSPIVGGSLLALLCHPRCEQQTATFHHVALEEIMVQWIVDESEH